MSNFFAHWLQKTGAGFAKFSAFLHTAALTLFLIGETFRKREIEKRFNEIQRKYSDPSFDDGGRISKSEQTYTNYVENRTQVMQAYRVIAKQLFEAHNNFEMLFSASAHTSKIKDNNKLIHIRMTQAPWQGVPVKEQTQYKKEELN